MFRFRKCLQKKLVQAILSIWIVRTFQKAVLLTLLTIRRLDFSYEDHDRLADLFVRLDKLGAYVMLSNNDVPLVRELYREYNIEPLEVKRLINRNAAKRSGKEVIVTLIINN